MMEAQVINAIISDNPALSPLIAIIPDELLEIAGQDGEMILPAEVAAWLNRHAERWALKVAPYYEPEGVSPDAELRPFNTRWIIEFSSETDREQWKAAGFCRTQEHVIG